MPLAAMEFEMPTGIIDDISKAIVEGQMLKSTSMRAVLNSCKLFAEVTGVKEQQKSKDVGPEGSLRVALDRFATPVPPYAASGIGRDRNMRLNVPPNTASGEDHDGNTWLKQPIDVGTHEGASVPLYGACLEEPGGNMWLHSQTWAPPECTSSTLPSGTTVMIRNLPSKYTPQLLMWELDNAGFMRQYDYLYIPTGSRKGKNRGFAFVNFASVAIAESFRLAFDGATFALYRIRRPLVIVPADIQGWANNYQHQQLAPTHPFRMTPVFFRPLAAFRQVDSSSMELPGHQFALGQRRVITASYSQS